MTNKPRVKLPESIFSRQDLAAATLEVREYARWFAHEEIKRRAGATSTSTQPSISAAAEQIIREWKAVAPFSRARFDELLAILEDYKNSAPSLTFTLAAPPTNGIKTQLAKWCRENIAPHVLVSFKFNSSLLGGMVVQSGSRILDWSFRRQVLDNRGRFAEILRNVR